MANFTLTPPYKPTVKSKKALRGAESGLDFGYFGDLWIRFSVERFGSGFMAGRCQLFRQQGGHASADSIQGHKTIRDRQRPTETDRKQQKLQSPLTLPVWPARIQRLDGTRTRDRRCRRYHLRVDTRDRDVRYVWVVWTPWHGDKMYRHV